MGMRVGELSRRTGVGVSTLRAWERRFGFLQPERSPAGHRLYAESDVDRVDAVVRLVAEGLTLAAAVARVANVGVGALPDGEGEAMLFGQILRAAEQGIWVSMHGRTRFANRHMAEIMHCSVEELVATPVLEFFPPEELPAVRDRTPRVRSGGRLHFTTELRRLDGTTFPAEITSTPLLSPAGRYDGAVSIVNDITGRREAEMQSQLRSAALDSIAEAVTVATPQGTVVYVNAAAERMFGWRASNVVGRDPRGLIADAEVAAEADGILASVLRGEQYSGALTLSHRDGTTFLARVSATPVYDEHGDISGIITVINDDNERTMLEREARKHELQEETVALLGAQALRQHTDRGPSATVVIAEVLDATRRLLRADMVIMLDVVAGADDLEVRAASPPTDERVTVPAGSQSFSGYVALARKAVVVDNCAHDRRFDSTMSAAIAPSASCVGAPVFGPRGVVGVLTAASRTPGQFAPSDGHVIQCMANIIGTALLE